MARRTALREVGAVVYELGRISISIASASADREPTTVEICDTIDQIAATAKDSVRAGLFQGLRADAGAEIGRHVRQKRCVKE